jgi:GNAT superfamily N-acetyltransferase
MTTKILDTTELALHEVAQELADWINHTENTDYNLPIPNTSYRLELNAPNAYNTIDQKLFEFNKSCVPATQKSEVINLNFTIKNGDEVIAGICADVYIWKTLYISVFFVEENYCHQGLRTILLNKVEEKARSMGSTLSHVEPYDFQAKDFYIKQGYEIFCILDNCPPEHKRYFLKKSLNNEENKKNDFKLSDTTYEIIVDHSPSQADNDAVLEGLVVDYERLMGQPRDKEFSVFLKNDSGDILGGIQAQFDTESVYMETLWVEEKLRNKGYGSKLLNAAELEAIKNGCVFSTLDTWDFQAEDFYLKNGYKPMGKIKKYWREHSRIFLRKVL